MAKYCIEKFEKSGGEEKTMCWRQDKHVHDPSFITEIERRLGQTYGGIWSVRANSYRSNQSSCPPNAVDYKDLD